MTQRNKDELAQKEGNTLTKYTRREDNKGQMKTINARWNDHRQEHRGRE